MILVDTSVWIDYLNGVQSTHTDTLDSALIEGVVAMGDLILLEILQGIRDDRHYRTTQNALMALDQLEMFGPGMVLQCADNYRALRKKGITVRKTADVIIGTFCIQHRLPLLFTDRDFQPFVDFLGLSPALK